MFGMKTLFAELERSVIAERVRSGLARAKANGNRLGRPQLDPEKSSKTDALPQGSMPV